MRATYEKKRSATFSASLFKVKVYTPMRRPGLPPLSGMGLNSALFARQWRPLVPGDTHDMPTYEYSCTKCGQNFDAYQSMRDEPFKECPKELCRLEKWGHGKVKRLLGTGAGLIFKGSGFYITDYRSKNYQEGAKKEAPVSTASTSSPEKSPAKTDGAIPKPAATPPKVSENKAKKEASQ